MISPIISVILSVYNGEKYLSEAIESILNQTYTNIEFIIIDDGSTDSSLEIIKSYDDNRIVLISRENKGLIYSLNEGITLAKGKYVARMDADDIAFSRRLEKQVAYMETELNIGICGTAVKVFGEGISEHLWKLPLEDKRIKAELLFSSALAHPTVMMRKELTERYKLVYDTSFKHAEDFELWTRFAEYIKMANLPEPLLRYRILKNSASRLADSENEERYKIMRKIPERYMSKLGIVRDENQTRLHFNLSVNTRMEKEQIDFVELRAYFALLVEANKKTEVFDRITLCKVLGKKWLLNIYYRKTISALFSKYTFYGIWGILTK